MILLYKSALRLLDWLASASSDFQKSVGTITRWFGEIVGYFEQGTTNGVVEGINNKRASDKTLRIWFQEL